MSGKFPTAKHVADLLSHELDKRRGPIWPIVGRSRVARQPGPAFMDTRSFDITLADGRVYRVRVSDITPEKVGA